ncbi:MAG: N-acetyltransferase [Paracoccaceae bacterium]|nr:N-acetyltransferase [Paracoccaceae bacterium]
MNAVIEIRLERTGDEKEIFDLTAVAFEPMAYSDGTEPQVVNDLRADGDLTLSIVAVKNGKIVGHVAFSPIAISDNDINWFGLGPISVLPELQRTGIGSAIIYKGLSLLKEKGAAGCALIGDPNYYGRFGFIGDGRLKYQQLPDALVQGLSFNDFYPEGVLTFRPAFGD